MINNEVIYTIVCVCGIGIFMLLILTVGTIVTSYWARKSRGF